jgi:hypothetical protein
LIDEKAINFRVEVWDNPPMAPKMEESRIEIVMSLPNIELDFSKQNKIKTKGAIFCHVRINIVLIQLKPSII